MTIERWIEAGPMALAAVLLATACTRHDGAPAAAPATAPVRVAVETLAPAAVPEVVEAVGTVRSRTQTVVSSRIVAGVVAVHAREGQVVEPGRLLIELDDRDARAQLARARAGWREAQSVLDEVERSIEGAEQAVVSAQAQADLARITHDRRRQLVERELIARQDYDEAAAGLRVATAEMARARQALAALLARRRQAEARIAQAQAEVDGATVALDFTRIAAPVGGIVAARTVEEGNLAAPGVPLLTIDEEHYRLEAAVHESDLPQLRAGQAAEVTIDATGRVLTGPIVEIVPAADSASRTSVVKIDLPERAGVRTGLYGRAAFRVGARRALLVPRSAVSVEGQVEAVFVVDAADVARLRLVRTGKAMGEAVEVLSGLGAGERVVVEAHRARDGQPIVAER